jgi:phosphoserine phosphatase
MIKAVLLDFDGTLITKDLSIFLAEKNGKGAEALQSLKDFQSGKTKGLQGLVNRVNMLQGTRLSDVEALLDRENFLRQGANEFTDYLHDNGIVSILASGSILPALEYYQRKFLKLDYVIGSRVRLRDGVIQGITLEDFSHPDYKLFESQKILEALGITAAETLAIGDSVGDKSRFEFAAKAIAINPVGGIEKLADYTIHDDLTQAIPIIEKLNNKH